MSAFGRYRIVGRIAAGGMGEVYRAVAVGPGGVEKPVALKVMKPFLSDDPKFVQMFEEESKVSFLLVHGNVVQTYDVGKVDDRWFIAMEFVDGTTLEAVLERCRKVGQPLAHRHAIYVAVEALRGLEYAYRAKDARGIALAVVHRDISPGNLFVSRAGEVKVGDFGIAQSSLGARHTVSGTLKGKIAYMSPEQCRGEALDARVDVYAMGVVLYEALTLRRPFKGSGPETIPSILAGDFPRPREINAEIPVTLESIVVSAMSKERDHRPGSAKALLESLEEFALRAGWSLSSSAFAEFVERLGEDPPTPEKEDRFLELKLGTEFDRVDDRTFTTAKASPRAKHDGRTDVLGPKDTRADRARQAARSPPRSAARFAVVALVGAAVLGIGVWTMMPDPVTAPDPDAVPDPVAVPDPIPDTAAPATARPAARDPWSADVPSALAALRAEIASGNTSNWREVMRYALETKEPRAFLLAGHAYFRRDWHGNAIENYRIALQGGERGTVTGDPTLRGDPELLANLMFLLRSTRLRVDVASLVAGVWQDEAIGPLQAAARNEDEPETAAAARDLLVDLQR